ncbi:MAG: polyprenyl synthetase family protein [Pauljensenia sp.]
MTTASVQDHLLGLVDARLEAFLASRRAETADPAFTRLWDLLARSFQGGKRIRPLLVLTVATHAGTRMDTDVLSAAAGVGAAFELLHTGFLIHDDIMDRDILRRGRPTVAAELMGVARDGGDSDATHTGASGAIITGDLALTGAYRLLADAGPSMPHVVEIVDEALRRTAEGQLRDISTSPTAHPGEEDLLELARLKTGVYSFEAPIACGAVLSGLGPTPTAELAAGARDLGGAFQVVDDLLGTVGDPERTGKSTSSDLRRRKHTVLTVRAAARDPRWPGIWDDLGQGDADEAERLAREVIVSSGACDHARELSSALHHSARTHFTHPSVPEPLACALVALTDTLEARTR